MQEGVAQLVLVETKNLLLNKVFFDQNLNMQLNVPSLIPTLA
jgi:hypothetical protein